MALANSAISSSSVGLKRPCSDSSSAFTPGGTRSYSKHQKQEDRGGILWATQNLMSVLSTYSKHFIFLGNDHPWFCPPNMMLSAGDHLLTALLRTGDSPDNKVISNYTCSDPSRIVELLRYHSIKLPTFDDITEEKYTTMILGQKDPSADDWRNIELLRNKILSAGNHLYPVTDKPSLSVFGKHAAWHKMQNSPLAILCHRPAANRPHIPLKVMHSAFYEFCKDTPCPADKEMEAFRRVAYNLGGHLTEPLTAEPDRADRILQEFRKIFPEDMTKKWSIEKKYENKGRVDLLYRKYLSSEYRSRFGEKEKDQPYIDLIIIEVKLEEGENGDAFLQLCRYFDVILEGNRRLCETGAPTFLISMSGPNIKLCGGWADNPGTPEQPGVPAVDVFNSLFACQDRAGDHAEKLVKALYSLSKAVPLLPSCHIPRDFTITPDIPSIFKNYQLSKAHPLFRDAEDVLPLQILARLQADLRYSVFHAHAAGLEDQVQEGKGNCVAKLVFGYYGLEVHQALEEVDQALEPSTLSFAPKLYGQSLKTDINAAVYVMERLPPPKWNMEGWVTLHDLKADLVFPVLDELVAILKKIVGHLEKCKFAHGDLRPNNMMIKMSTTYEIAQPMHVKIINFEWAGRIDSARYPLNRSTSIRYPGEAGGLIGSTDDCTMINKWEQDLRNAMVFG
ncbi:hypothetical protein BDZ97DRAFT_1922386 [Flammula alnicola]|nr:hypothetical protein BDZ97DRAFT_1922386 [Flammula alnicola]